MGCLEFWGIQKRASKKWNETFREEFYSSHGYIAKGKTKLPLPFSHVTSRISFFWFDFAVLPSNSFF